MAEISKTASLSLSAIYPAGGQAESLIELAKNSGGNALQSVDLGGVSLHSDRIAVASGAAFTAQVTALRQAAANAARGAGALDVADSALTDINGRLARLQQLAETAARTPVTREDGSSYTPADLSAADRAILQAEFSDLRTQIDAIAGAASFDGTQLLSGDPSSPGNPLDLSWEVGVGRPNQVSASLDAADTASLSPDLATASLMSATAADAAVTAVADAQDALGNIQATVRGARSEFAAVTDARDQIGSVIDKARGDLTDPQVAVDLSRVVARKASDEGGVPLVHGAEQLLQAALLRASAVSSLGIAATPGGDGIEDFGGKTADAPALPSGNSAISTGSSSVGGGGKGASET